MTISNYLPGLLLALLGTGYAPPLKASPPYEAIYCFGFSWTDTQGLYPNGLPDFVNNNPKYWQNRASNGPMWPEFLSTKLGLTYLSPNNLARGAANSADTLAQVDKLNASTNPGHGLYVVWVAAGDFLSAADVNYGSGINWTNNAAWDRMIQGVLNTSSNIVERLYGRGARSIVVQNCLDLSLAPGVIRDCGGNPNELAKLKERTARFNADLQMSLQSLQDAKPDLRLFTVDIFSRENDVHADPAHYGLTKVFPDALNDPALGDETFAGPGRDYMFWDGLHGTSEFHELVAEWTYEALTSNVVENLEVTLSGTTVNLEMNRLLIGRAYALQSSVDLIRWQDLETFTAAAGTNRWTATPAASQTFYQLKWQP